MILIADDAELEQVLATLEQLLDDYEANEDIINQLCEAITLYEESAPSFAEFNALIRELDVK